jgi:hypothetical protein
LEPGLSQSTDQRERTKKHDQSDHTNTAMMMEMIVRAGDEEIRTKNFGVQNFSNRVTKGSICLPTHLPTSVSAHIALLDFLNLFC